MPKKILVILGQPQRHSYGGALMQAYVEAFQRVFTHLDQVVA